MMTVIIWTTVSTIPVGSLLHSDNYCLRVDFIIDLLELILKTSPEDG